MIAVRFWTPLAFTWYVLAGTIVTYAVGSLASLASKGVSEPKVIQE